MKLGLHLSRIAFPGGTPVLGADLARIVSDAEAAGFDRISVMDHVWQIGPQSAREPEMLEAYTTLGFLAAHTERAQLLTLVTGVTYRDPGLLVKMVTTLDVLSGGRAMLGIGAGWNEEEARGLGLFLPARSERFERLEEALQICSQMWSGDESGYQGKHYQLERTLNAPPPLRRPHPPVLIGGGGERKTLRLVAQYAQGCNLPNNPELPHKLKVLREHCERLGTDYDAIEKGVLFNFDVGADGERVDETLAQLRGLCDLGVLVAHGRVEKAWRAERFAVLKEQIVPVVASW